MTKRLWKHFLDLKENIENRHEWVDIRYIEDNGFVFSQPIATLGDSRVLLHFGNSTQIDWHTDNLFGSINLSYRSTEDAHFIQLMKLYLPLILSKFEKNDTPFVIVHMAQTVDGRISTCTGKSKWIGNQENLIHAHRIRALVDGVLVGGKTIEADFPRLNVRHVPGKNPKRLLLTNTFNDWEKLPIVEDAETILIRAKKCQVIGNHSVINRVLGYDSSTSQDNIFTILVELKKIGINSILVEGGPSVVGNFIACRKVDRLQFHIAPKVFGSGKSCVTLPEINDVNEGYDLKNVLYTQVGDAIMITGELKQ